MTIFEALLLGIIQGATEFLPISSSGHLVLSEAIMGIGEGGLLVEVTLQSDEMTIAEQMDMTVTVTDLMTNEVIIGATVMINVDPSGLELLTLKTTTDVLGQAVFTIYPKDVGDGTHETLLAKDETGLSQGTNVYGILLNGGGGNTRKVEGVFGNGTASNQPRSTTLLENNTWYHIAGTYDGRTRYSHVYGFSSCVF